MCSSENGDLDPLHFAFGEKVAADANPGRQSVDIAEDKLADDVQADSPWPCVGFSAFPPNSHGVTHLATVL